MKLPCRNFLHLAAGAVALPAVSRIAWAQAYPSRPVHLIVPFAPAGGADTIARLMGQMGCRSASASHSFIENRAGVWRRQLRDLAVTTATRSEALPDVPTVGEFVPGYEASSWSGLGAPRATPAEIVDKLNKEVNAALDDPKMKARLADLGGTPLPGSPAQFGKLIAEEGGTVFAGSPADFGKFIADETEKWAKVIRAANIKAE